MEPTLSMKFPSHPGQYRLCSNQSVSSNHSRETEFTTSTIRRRHARNIFAEFGISRPSGWLSDDEEEDFSRHQDGTNSIPRHVSNICHSCGAEVTSRTFCNTCGHVVCPQCASEIPDDEESLDIEHPESMQQKTPTRERHTLNMTQEHSRSSSTLEYTEVSKKKQRPAAIPVTLKDNPFIRADRMTKVTAAEPQITDATVRAGQVSRLSDCVLKQVDLSIVGTRGDYRNHRCNATHAGHHSGRHSIACIVEHQASAEKMGDSNQLSLHHSLADPVQDKIDKMYHHAEDLRRAQHIVKHLAAGFIPNEGTTQPSQDDILRVTTSSVENILSQVNSSGLNREELVSFDMAMAEDRERSRAWNVHNLERSQSFDVDPVKKRGSGSTPVRAEGRLASSPSWLKSPNQMKSRLVTTETRSTPQMKDAGRNNSAAMSPLLGPEATTSPASAVSLHSTKSSSQLLQTQSEQYGPPKKEPAIQWPKLKKVVQKITSEADKEPLPWMKKPLRRVQKEENMSQQVREQNSAHVESWRSQLRKTQALHADSPEGQHGEDANYGDRKRANTCLTCRHETPSPPLPPANAIKTTPVIPTKTSKEAINAEHEDQDDQLNTLMQKRLEETQFSSSQRSTSRTLTTTKVELDTATHISEANEVVHSTLGSLTTEETSVGSVKEAGEEPSRNHTDKIEVFSPIPIMPPNHTCSWKERYLNLTAEVRQLKAEMVSPERYNTSEHVDVGTKASQGDDNDLGVEGLTIVMHLKGKDDLIINTDLTQASSDV